MPGFIKAPWKARLSFGRWEIYQHPRNWDGMGFQAVCIVPASRKKTHYGELFAATARLIVEAPAMFRLVKRIADGKEVSMADATRIVRRVLPASLDKN